MLRFLHTSDWQLGAGFGQIPGDNGARLREERLAAVDRIGALAHKHEAQFVLIAGDMFDAHTVDNEVVTRALDTIKRFSMPVYAIPGNHDFAGAVESVYKRDRFRERCPSNFTVLFEPKACSLSKFNLELFPCPLVQRHTVSDPTRWLVDAIRDASPTSFRVGLAHGSVVNFQSEEDGTSPNLIDPSITQRANLDYLALGDWHGVHKVNDRTWYSGAPEPDRFKDNDSGHVLLVTIPSPRSAPQVETLPSAGFQWIRHEVNLHGEEDIALLDRWFHELSQPQRTLVRLELSGVLGMEGMERLTRILDTQAELCLHLRRRGPGVQLKPTDEELNSIGRGGLTGRVVDELRALLESQDETASAATIALQELFQRVRASNARGAG